MKTPPILIAGAALLALAGCNFAPRYQRPEVKADEHFKEAVPGASTASQGWRIAEPNDAGMKGNWWEQFHDPELNELEERVAISNQTVVAAEANYRAASALADEARAGLFPTLSLDPSVIRSRESAAASSNGGATTGGSTGQASGTSTATRTLYTAPLAASYEVDLWGRVRNTIAQSADTAQASAADVATALLSTRTQLAQDYFQVREVDEQRRILDATLGDYEASLHLVRALFRDGLASEEDLAEADTQLDSAEAQATDLGIARAQYEHAIAVLIGVVPARFSMPVRPFNPALPAVPVALPSDLVERRPDIAASERQVAAANAAIGIARAAYFPALSLGASAGYESNGLSKLFLWPNRFWSVGPSAAETLFEGGALRAATAQARALHDAAVANYRQTVLAAFQSVEDNLASLRILAKEEAQQHRAVTAARREVRLSIDRYKLGLDSYVNVIAAQDTYLINREAELQVQLRRITASINLIDNVGGGWDTSQLGRTGQTAMSPPSRDGNEALAAGTGEAVVPNPPPLPLEPPEELMQQDDADAPVPQNPVR
jgi:NodT family efflux transporter outer membrane factor (OMF) lipoprotein